MGQWGDGTATGSLYTASGAQNSIWRVHSMSSVSACGVEKGSAQLYCWGVNTYGNLGDGTSTSFYTPKLIGGQVRYLTVMAGTYHVSAVAASWCPVT